MGYWIFKTNPEKYRIDKRLTDPEVRTTWEITRYRDRIRAGDIAFVWRTGPNRGLRAVMRITCDPAEMYELPSELPYYIDLDPRTKLRVLGDLVQRFPLIKAEDIKSTPGLEGLSVFHGFQMATNFEVTEEEGRILGRLVATRLMDAKNR